MDQDLEGLRTFVAIADAGGLTAATGRLGRTTSALSRRVAQIEERLGTTLFDRSTKHFRLTGAGQLLLECGRRVLEDVEATTLKIRQQKDDGQRQIVVASFDSMAVNILPRAIRAFCSDSPHTIIQIREMNSPSVIEAVTRQSVDIGIVVKGPLPPHLIYSPLFADPFVLACLPASPLASRRQISWRDLQEQRVIGYSPGTINRAILDRALLARGVKITWTYQVQQIVSAVALLEQDLGVLVLPASARFTFLDRKQIRIVSIRGPSIARSIGIVKRDSDSHHAHLERFEQCIRDAAEQFEAPSP